MTFPGGDRSGVIDLLNMAADLHHCRLFRTHLQESMNALSIQDFSACSSHTYLAHSLNRPLAYYNRSMVRNGILTGSSKDVVKTGEVALAWL